MFCRCRRRRRLTRTRETAEVAEERERALGGAAPVCDNHMLRSSTPKHLEEMKHRVGGSSSREALSRKATFIAIAARGRKWARARSKPRRGRL